MPTTVPAHQLPPGAYVRTYYGVPIYRTTHDGRMGLRYEAYVGGRLWRADTLEGIKSVIRRCKGL